jgi:hypothetical protein
MTNTNCLEGIQCPQCGNADRFRIAATSIFTVTDDGTEGHGDVEWDDGSHAECAACRHRGVLKDFRAAAALEATVSFHRYHITAWCDRTFTTVFDVEAESPEQALAIARERAHDEPAEECNDAYPWDTFSVADEHNIELLAWAEDEVTLRDAAGALLNACRLVLDRWEGGDLAEAARACHDAVAMATANALPPDEAWTIRIEVRGGVVQEVSNVPPGWAYQIVDYDDAEDNA